MKVTYIIDKELKTVFVKATGEISVHDLIENEKNIINDPDFERGLNTLADFTLAKPADNVNFQTVTMARDFVKSIQETRGACRWAMVAPRDPAYGISRMFSILSIGLSIETNAFRTEEEAKKWLGLQ